MEKSRNKLLLDPSILSNISNLINKDTQKNRQNICKMKSKGLGNKKVSNNEPNRNEKSLTGVKEFVVKNNPRSTTSLTTSEIRERKKQKQKICSTATSRNVVSAKPSKKNKLKSFKQDVKSTINAEPEDKLQESEYDIEGLIKNTAKIIKKLSKTKKNTDIESKSLKNNNKVKRLQNKTTFKLDQHARKPTNKTKFSPLINNPEFQKQVKKDLLNVKYPSQINSKNNKALKTKLKESLRERMQNQLKSSRFRYLNECLYTNEGKDAKHFFQQDPDSFEAYHEGFRQQVAKWPMNPLDEIIVAIRKMSKDKIIADFGCGEAKLARSVPQKVYSFDLLETVPGVIACDMANCQLPSGSVDAAVFCLSLMGTNLRDFLAEASRVLKIGGILKIAEVESRFGPKNVDNFIKSLRSFGFSLTWKNLSHNLFYFLDFKKDRNIQDKNKLYKISLQPCLYKKR